MKKLIFPILILAMVITMAACGQTQAPPAVVDTAPHGNSTAPPAKSPEQTADTKQSALLMGMTPDAYSPYDAPAHVSGEYRFDALIVAFNADVTVPEATSYPVVKMLRRTLTNKEIFGIVNLLADTSNGVYGKWDAPKEQWQAWIDEASRYMSEPWMDGSYMLFLKECYNAAQETVSREPIDSASIVQGTAEQTFYVPSQNGITAHKFQVFEDGFIYSANAVSDGLYGLKTEIIRKRDAAEFSANFESREQYLWNSPGEPEITQEEAYTQAVKLLDDMGLGDLTVSYAEPCCFLDNYVNKTTGLAVTFTRSAAGLSVQEENLQGSSFISFNAAPAYFAPWSVERALISIAKDGVRGITVRGMSNISGTEIESVRLMPFDAMQERIADTLNRMYAAQMQAENPSVKGEITVTSALLGMSLIADNGQTEEGFYVPSWIVNYSLTTAGGDQSGQIIFNAADGNYIEPRMTARDLDI